MPPLASDLRRRLESVVVQARDLADTAAGSALQRWAVDAAKPFGHFSLADGKFRKRLRARGKQAGDRRSPDAHQGIDQLTQQLAYEYWHRMLFARFLAENHLLMHPDGVVVTLAECEELAPTERAPNGFALAARYASRMLPQIFRVDDVLLDVELPVNDRLPLEKLLAELPSQVFTADDSLGWVYQFWQSKKKDEVNKSGQKIDGRSLPAITQLFTEHYMVEFLLHNTVGAWRSARHGLKRPAELEPRKEENGRDIEPRMKHGLNTDKDNNKRVSDSDPCFIRVSSVAENEFVSSMAKRFTYLRWRDDGTPVAGTFEGWPKTLREFTMLDPCCGSGHFLVAGFHLLVPLRMHDEGLSAKEAVDAVLRENLFGLEIDPRYTQIAAFALAMAAWKFSDENGEPLGYRPLPPLNVAFSGQGVVGTKEQWTKFADGDSRFKEGTERLYDLFHKAPTLGSLIDRRTVADDLFTFGFDALKMIILEAKSLGCRLSEYAKALAGINSGDAPRFVRKFRELGAVREGWEFQQTTTDITSAVAGYENIFLWEKGAGTHARFIQSLGGRLGGSWRRGQEAWGKQGVAVSQMSNLPVSLYNGNLFDNSTAVILPHDPAYLPAIWAFCRSPEFLTSVRAINQKINVDNGYLSKIQFDFAKWSEISDASGPIPPIASNNATQWLFRGHPKGSTDALQVAVARLLGFRWPDQEPDDLDTLADKDGIVPIPSMRGEPPAADRLREVLRTAFGSEWSGSFEHKLLTEAGAKSGTSLDDWLLNSFFEQHCRRFHHRPFVWHVWGRTQGRLCLPGELPQARSGLARNPDLFLSPGLDQRSGRRGEGEQDRCRSSPERRPGVAG